MEEENKDLEDKISQGEKGLKRIEKEYYLQKISQNLKIIMN